MADLQNTLNDINKEIERLRREENWLISLTPKYEAISKNADTAWNWSRYTCSAGIIIVASCLFLGIPPTITPYLSVLACWLFASGMGVSMFYTGCSFYLWLKLKKLKMKRELIKNL